MHKYIHIYIHKSKYTCTETGGRLQDNFTILYIYIYNFYVFTEYI